MQTWGRSTPSLLSSRLFREEERKGAAAGRGADQRRAVWWASPSAPRVWPFPPSLENGGQKCESYFGYNISVPLSGGVSTTLSRGRGVPGSCVAARGQRKLRAGAGRGQPVLGIRTSTALCGACRGEYQQQAHEQVAACLKATDQCPRTPSALALQWFSELRAV